MVKFIKDSIKQKRIVFFIQLIEAYVKQIIITDSLNSEMKIKLVVFLVNLIKRIKIFRH